MFTSLVSFLSPSIGGEHARSPFGTMHSDGCSHSCSASKLACERPDQLSRSLSQWDCSELARQLQADGIVQGISPATIRRVLHTHQLKPWRHHLWLSPKVPRDQSFVQQIQTLIDCYTRPL